VCEGDIAYLWPSASLEAHRILHARGIPVVLEGINTRMASAKRILDDAYDAFGTAPVHGITETRIAEEEAKYGYASAIFAPSRSVEAALKGSPLEHRILPASYGVDVSRASPKRNYDTGSRPLTFLFCGYACVRKGVHHLLDAWKRMPEPHRLRLVGRIEPAIADRYHDLLASDRIEVVGFVRDVHPHFAAADVFVMPSLEEGDPLVTYEAALHGLPIVASSMGAGRMGDSPGAMEIVDPADVETLTTILSDLATMKTRREELGQTVWHLARGFGWPEVGARRAIALQALFSPERSALP